jgi:hypothetical protein
MSNAQLEERKAELRNEGALLGQELEESKKLRLLQRRQMELQKELSQIDGDLKTEQTQKKLLDQQTSKNDSAKRLIGGLYSSGTKPDFEATGLTFVPGAESNEMEVSIDPPHPPSPSPHPPISPALPPLLTSGKKTGSHLHRRVQLPTFPWKNLQDVL